MHNDAWGLFERAGSFRLIFLCGIDEASHMMSGQDMVALWRNVHGIAVLVITASPEVQACAEHLFHHFASIEPGRSDISLALHVVADVLPPSRTFVQATPVHAQGELTYLVNSESFYISVGHRGVFHTDCAAQVVVGYVTPGLISDPALLRNLVLNALTPLLRRQGIFPLHGFAATRGDHAAILVGKSGKGKTTAGLALVRADWGFLSNDHPLLHQDSSGISVLCYCEPINISATTATFFPELRHVFNEDSGQLRRSFEIEDVYGSVVTERAQVGLLLFPQISGESRSKLMRLSQGEALAILLPNSLDAWDKAVMAANFSLLASLVKIAPAYRLDLGRDFDALPGLVGELLPKG